jgi:hypothetical protein
VNRYAEFVFKYLNEAMAKRRGHNCRHPDPTKLAKMT